MLGVLPNTMKIPCMVTVLLFILIRRIEMERKSVLAIAAVAMFALAIGQVQAESIDVPNRRFSNVQTGDRLYSHRDLSG